MPTQRKCARCRTPYFVADATLPNAAKDYTPFCSKRCADIDLGHWLKGDYVIDGSGALGTEAGDNPDSEDLSSSFHDEEPE